LRAFVDLLPSDEINWDIVTGVSVGSMNAFAIAIHAPGDEKGASELLMNLWTGINSSLVYQSWPGGISSGIYAHSGIYNNQPLRDYIKELSSGHKLKRKISIGAVDANRGIFLNYNESLPIDDFREMVIASGSVPAIFPFIPKYENNYMDGGTIINIDISTAVNRCRDMGYKDENIILDMMFCTGGKMIEVDASRYNSLHMMMRKYELDKYERSLHYLVNSFHEYPDVQFRYLVIPLSRLPSGYLPLEFKKEQIEEMIKIGYNDTVDIIKRGEGAMIQYILDEYNNSSHRRY